MSKTHSVMESDHIYSWLFFYRKKNTSTHPLFKLFSEHRNHTREVIQTYYLSSRAILKEYSIYSFCRLSIPSAFPLCFLSVGGVFCLCVAEGLLSVFFFYYCYFALKLKIRFVFRLPFLTCYWRTVKAMWGKAERVNKNLPLGNET